MAAAKKTEYSANDLLELDDKTHYRKRPRLVWGEESGNPDSPFSTMQMTAFREIYENSVDESLQGFADRLDVKIFEDHSFEVSDNGRGIPTDVNTTTGKSGIMQALGTLRSGRNFDSHDNKKSTGTNGLGASAVTIFAKRLDVTVYRGGKKHQLSFKHGDAGFFDGEGPDAKFTKLKDLSYLEVSKDDRKPKDKLGKTGTTIRVWFDPETFPTRYHYNDQEIIERLKGTAFLIPHMTVTVRNELHKIKDETAGTETIQEETFHFPEGLSQMVTAFQKDQPLMDPVTFSGTTTFISKNVPVVQPDGSIKNEDVEREIAYNVGFAYGSGFDFTVRSYVNTVSTSGHGSHLVGTQRAMAEAFNERFSSMRGLLGKNDEPPIVEDFAEGLTLMVSVFMNEPPFDGQSKSRMNERTLVKPIQTALRGEFENWIANKKNSADLDLIAKKVVEAAKARQKAQSQRDLQRQKSELSQGSLPPELIDCELSGTDAAELYICEGDSAKTALKAARDGQKNALLGIRGKIINAYGEKKKMSEVLSSKPVQSIIKCLGAGAGNDFDISKVRYGRVFFAVDADVDGNSIACGLYALFWTLFRPMVEEGRLYKIEAPLFSISTKQGKSSRKIYARDDAARDEIAEDLDRKNIKYKITRLKGLGEMKEDDLEETAIDPATRIVTQVTADDVAAAQTALELLFGEDARLRKDWIESSEVDEDLLLE